MIYLFFMADRTAFLVPKSFIVICFLQYDSFISHKPVPDFMADHFLLPFSDLYFGVLRRVHLDAYFLYGSKRENLQLQ